MYICKYETLWAVFFPNIFLESFSRAPCLSFFPITFSVIYQLFPYYAYVLYTPLFIFVQASPVDPLSGSYASSTHHSV